MNELALKVDTFAQALIQVQKENDKLKAQVEKLESPKSTWGYMTLASIVVAIIALVLSLLRKGISREKVDEIFSYNLDKSKRIAELKIAVSQLQSAPNNNRVSQSVNTSLQDIDVRLRSVETSVSRLNIKQTKFTICHTHQLTSAKNSLISPKNLNISRWDMQTLTAVMSLRRFLIQPKKVVYSQFNLKVLLKENLASYL